MLCEDTPSLLPLQQLVVISDLLPIGGPGGSVMTFCCHAISLQSSCVTQTGANFYQARQLA